MNEFLNILKNYPVFFFQNQHPSEEEKEHKAMLAIKSTMPVLSDGCTNIPELEKPEWNFGFVSYDYKNKTEKLYSKNPDSLNFPDIFFFRPEALFSFHGSNCETLINTIGFPEDAIRKMNFATDEINLSEIPFPALRLKCRLSKEEYIRRVIEIKQHIRKGDIYEMNFCQEFYVENVRIDPVSLYHRLNIISPAPFSSLCRFGDKYLISSSPERFLQKTGTCLSSQPIKGTRPRGNDHKEDIRLKNELLLDEKERAENVMIVDLVRNDLSRIAQKGSVIIDELFGIYSFEQVHQMISTVSCKLKTGISFEEILRATFPMGSMTGAPKIRAMQLIEEYEVSKRGLYSGAFGYISPDGDFDFSVVIRSILYNSSGNYVSFMTGSAITDKSDPEKEYEECLLKAKALMQSLNASIYTESSWV